jgi:hypothetical protein
VSDRDLVLRVRQLPPAADGTREVRFEAVRDGGPPPNPKFVRLSTVRGAWKVTPAADGRTQVEYTCYAEPGGSVPAMFTRGAQRDQIPVDVQNVLKKLSPAAPAKKN